MLCTRTVDKQNAALTPGEVTVVRKPTARGERWRTNLVTSDAPRRSYRHAQQRKFIFANFANDPKIFSQSMKNFRILRRCEGIAEAQRVIEEQAHFWPQQWRPEFATDALSQLWPHITIQN